MHWIVPKMSVNHNSVEATGLGARNIRQSIAIHCVQVSKNKSSHSFSFIQKFRNLRPYKLHVCTVNVPNNSELLPHTTIAIFVTSSICSCTFDFGLRLNDVSWAVVSIFLPNKSVASMGVRLTFRQSVYACTVSSWLSGTHSHSIQVEPSRVVYL